VDEPTAWLYQARADWQAAERFVADEIGTGRCHAIAKWQQTVEKAIKALMAALHDAGILGAGFRARHEVGGYIDSLIRLPRSTSNRAIQQLLHGMLDPNTRAGIKTLDGLAPRFPPQRNTEYPFQVAQDRWVYPAAEEVFSQGEVQQFRDLAYRVLDGAERVVSGIRRQPR